MTTPGSTESLMQEAARKLLDASRNWQRINRAQPPMSDDPPYDPIDPTAWLDWADNQSVPARREMNTAIAYMQSLTTDEVPTHPMNIEIYCAKWLANAN
jgi:hypothetical protein